MLEQNNMCQRSNCNLQLKNNVDMKMGVIITVNHIKEVEVFFFTSKTRKDLFSHY